ncbi:MAG TPA: nucleotide exchange factor GrpE [Gemmatimonadales bacterium]|jgi:molecular chaperone GrpE
MRKKHRPKAPETPAPESPAPEDLGDGGAAFDVADGDAAFEGANGAADVPDVAEDRAFAVEGPAGEIIQRLESERDEARDQLLRTAAEMDNFRKRTARERADMWTKAQAALAGRVIEALDDLNRVLELEVGPGGAEAILDGVRMVERKLVRELENAGLERLGEVGERFDPNHHEAVGTVVAERPEDDGTVADVFQPGYRFGSTLLRPARVRVAIHQGASA